MKVKVDILKGGREEKSCSPKKLLLKLCMRYFDCELDLFLLIFSNSILLIGLIFLKP